MAPSHPQARRGSRTKSPDRNLALLRSWSQRLEQNRGDASGVRIIGAFLQATRRAYDHLRDACRRDTGYAAWACLSLLELRILAAWVARSPQARRDFCGDRTRELDGFLTAHRAIAAALLPGARLDPAPLMRELPDQEPVGIAAFPTVPSMAALAAELGLAGEYEQMQKLTLPWSRPSALSVLSMENDEPGKATTELLFLAGGKYVAEILHDLIPLAHKTIAEDGNESFLM